MIDWDQMKFFSFIVQLFNFPISFFILFELKQQLEYNIYLQGRRSPRAKGGLPTPPSPLVPPNYFTINVFYYKKLKKC